MSRRIADVLLAVLLLCAAWPALAHAAAPLGLDAASLALTSAAHHLRALLTTAAVVAALRAVPRPSARLLSLLFAPWAARLILRGTSAA